jgi:DNA-binding beta-propeller fold protein YncE
MTRSHFNRVVDLCVAAALLAGCGGPQSPIGAPGALPVQQMRSGSTALTIPELKRALASPRYKVKAPLLYVTNVSYDDVTIYRAKARDPAPLATISNGIFIRSGACVDGQGTLYVANQPASGGWVSEYPLGETRPSKTITAGINAPGFCAIDAKGNLWVSNIYGPNVTEYLKGSKKPHTVITKGLVYPVGVAIDRSGDLYVANRGASEKNIEAYAPGSKSPSRTITTGVTSPVGIAVDSNGVLYVTNIDQNTVAEYRSGQGYPFQTITQAMDEPAGVAVNKEGKVYVSNIANGTVVEFAPGSLKPLKRQINKGLYGPIGIAYYPALLP